jgi:hypothetical protein
MVVRARLPDERRGRRATGSEGDNKDTVGAGDEGKPSTGNGPADGGGAVRRPTGARRLGGGQVGALLR